MSMAAGVQRTGSALGPHPGRHCYMAGAVMVSPDTAARCSPVHAEHASCSLINKVSALSLNTDTFTCL